MSQNREKFEKRGGGYTYQLMRTRLSKNVHKIITISALNVLHNLLVFAGEEDIVNCLYCG